MKNPYVTTAEAARKLGVTRQTVRNMLRDKRLIGFEMEQLNDDGSVSVAAIAIERASLRCAKQKKRGPKKKNFAS